MGFRSSDNLFSVHLRCLVSREELLVLGEFCRAIRYGSWGSIRFRAVLNLSSSSFYLPFLLPAIFLGHYSNTESIVSFSNCKRKKMESLFLFGSYI